VAKVLDRANRDDTGSVGEGGETISIVDVDGCTGEETRSVEFLSDLELDTLSTESGVHLSVSLQVKER
jgi:hypothetical protein